MWIPARRRHASAHFLEQFPDRLVREVKLPVRLGIDDASVLEPGIQFGIGFESSGAVSLENGPTGGAAFLMVL